MTAIDLAQETDFVLGALCISPSTREVTRGDWREQLEPRVMQVLVALHQSDGKVVSRDELIALCWEGRVVGDDAINRAIGRLRRLSQADDEASFRIDTIARVGYRLRPGKITVPPARVVQPAMPPPTPTRLRPWAWTAGIVLVLGLAAGLSWWFWPTPRWSVTASRPLLTTLAMERDPAFSPDGAMIAYAAGSDQLTRHIYVRRVEGGTPIQITHDGYDDVSPSWSPDGTRLVYVAQKSGEPCRLMIVAVAGGEPQEAARCAKAERSRVSWQPDSNNLSFIDTATTASDRLIRLDMSSGERREIMAEQPGSFIIDGQISRDGQRLIYTDIVSYSHYRLMVRSLGSNEERQLGKLTDAGYAAWSSDGRTVFTAVGRDSGAQLWAYPANGAAPYQVYALAADASHIAVGPNGLLALEHDAGRSNLARAAAAPSSQAAVIDPAGGQVWTPAFAPDGTLAFVSNRSGQTTLWLMSPGAAPQPLLENTSVSRIRWSPDGTRLALVMHGPHGPLLKIITRQGAPVASFELPSVGFGMPNWGADGKSLFYFNRPAMKAFRLRLDGNLPGTPAAPALMDGIREIAGHLYALRADAPGIWQVDGGVRQITEKLPAGWTGPLTFDGAGNVLLPDFTNGDVPRLLAQPLAGGAPHAVAWLPDAGPWAEFDRNPKTGEIVYVADVVHDTNIDLLTLKNR